MRLHADKKLPLRALTTAAVILVGSTCAFADSCPGSTYQYHRLGSFVFQTNSRIESDVVPFLRYLFCVTNIDKRNDLWVHWYTPGLKSWIPADEKLEFPRLAVYSEPRSLASCLEYGNLAAITTAQFLGTAQDEERAAEEKKNGCKPTSFRPSGPQKTPLFDKVFMPLRLFFPSNAERPAETMLSFSGQLYLQNIGDNRFQSALFYTVANYRGRDSGDPEAVSLRPVFLDSSPASASLSQSFREENGSLEIRLGKEGAVKFSMIAVGSWYLTNARYEFLDNQKRIVAAIEIPVVLSSP